MLRSLLDSQIRWSYALFPAHLLWRLSMQLIYLFDERVAAETFAMVLSKPLASTQDRKHS